MPLTSQSMPAGDEVTRLGRLSAPAMARPSLTLTESVYVLSVKVAVTDVAEVTVTVHVPVPLQPPPLQLVKVDPVAGDAVSVTVEP